MCTSYFTLSKPVPVHATKMYTGADVQLDTFLFLALDGGEMSASCLWSKSPFPIYEKVGRVPELFCMI